MPKVLVTGITGFLGSHVAEYLSEQDDVQISGLRRKNSNLWRCNHFLDQINWIMIDEDDQWKSIVVDLAPEVIVHCAWDGVEAKDRGNWDVQKKNLDFLLNVLDSCKEIRLKKFIFFGSQAEYGIFSGKIKEDFPSNPNNAYSNAKNACLALLKNYADNYKFDWIWLRIFSVFGEREGDNWLIPSLVNRMKTEIEMDFTPGKQQYAYLYARDFSKIVYRMIEKDIEMGVYNVSSNNIISIKDLVIKIRDQVNPNFRLNFGNIPYRIGQSMHVEGNIEKLQNQIGEFDFSDFNLMLENTINSYLKNNSK
ncbi:NAD-dependent epimerase/dehydratase family protein [Sphingobacterium anhuiense]|uniref:NAD-dependent epimerase/dehydratase family protein n=1 Tax=Sphingobacterium anhuiense TaxID=493780 RepID=UPI003C2D7B49